jgi:hypothetical protein
LTHSAEELLGRLRQIGRHKPPALRKECSISSCEPVPASVAARFNGVVWFNSRFDNITPLANLNDQRVIGGTNVQNGGGTRSD